jgi:hypothetical protein
MQIGKINDRNDDQQKQTFQLKPDSIQLQSPLLSHTPTYLMGLFLAVLKQQGNSKKHDKR